MTTQSEQALENDLKSRFNVAEVGSGKTKELRGGYSQETLNASQPNDSLVISAHSHHKSTTLCFACTLNTLTETFYMLLDSQPQLDSLRPEAAPLIFDDTSNSMNVLDSSCSLNMHYLLVNLHNTELFEFEAYLSIARGLIEKISRFLDVSTDEVRMAVASQDLDDSFDDVTLLFEAKSAAVTAKTLKRAKWLGRGTDRSNIAKEVYELLYAYLSRVVHVSNMDTLLQPREDRFLIKAYTLVTVASLYHECMGGTPHLTKTARDKHKDCYDKICKLWKDTGLSPETLIYVTTFYNDKHTEAEKQAWSQYVEGLGYAFDLWNKKGAHVLPRYQFIEEPKA